MRLAVVLLAALALAACGDDGGDADDGGDTRGEAPASYSGRLIVLPDGTANLCLGAIMESAPPQCAEPFLRVEGLDDPASLDGVTDVGGWLEGDVTIEGVARGGVLETS